MLRVLMLHEESQIQGNDRATTKLRQNHLFCFFFIRKARRSKASNSHISEESVRIARFCHAQMRAPAPLGADGGAAAMKWSNTADLKTRWDAGEE